MKHLIFLASLMIGGTAIAQTAPADQAKAGAGLDVHGHNPEGQAFVPAGFNTGVGQAVYPSVTMAPPALIGGDYPACSRQRTDRCVQTYTKSTSRRRR